MYIRHAYFLQTSSQKDAGERRRRQNKYLAQLALFSLLRMRSAEMGLLSKAETFLPDNCFHRSLTLSDCCSSSELVMSSDECMRVANDNERLFLAGGGK